MYASSPLHRTELLLRTGRWPKKSRGRRGGVLCSIYLTLQNILSTIIGVLGYAYMARVITPAEMGVIAGITLLASLIQIIVNLGLNSSIAKFISENIGKGADYSKYVISSLVLSRALYP